METNQALGKVQSVDTGNITIKVIKEELLNSVQVNQIIQIRSTKTGEKIIGLITKILRKAILESIGGADEPESVIENVIRVNLVGTLVLKEGMELNKFKRTLNTVPSIDADCFLLEGKDLSDFMTAISSNATNPLKVGKYTISDDSSANLDGNKFFQRHATIVGGTGSGKSWTVANILEKASKLKSVNSVLFDLHGEYKPLESLDNSTLLKIAGPSDKASDDGVIFLPHWLLSYEEMESLLLDRTDSNAPNQSRMLFDSIIEAKKATLETLRKEDVLNNFTVESPIPYKLEDIITKIEEEDVRMVPGANGREKQGPLFGKLTRFMQRLKSKQEDKRLNFLFSTDSELLDYDYLPKLIHNILGFGSDKGIKIIDFSEVPSDILPLITGLISRLVFSIQQWMDDEVRHPVALFCDEAHLYIPANPRSGSEEKGLLSFERIAKEGRKYGISLVVISQRPSDVNKTILSQCGNFVAMRLTNPEDQNVIKRLFPDNLGGFADLLPILDVGEALLVGDASLLPSRVIIDKPTVKPKSATVNFWDEWAEDKSTTGIKNAVEALRKQQK
ncbi:MAG: ATP-binding protein [Crocinitomicaceae bacterium]|nr:ATP-binding protein [Crocinitomicaceae bacterium]